MKKRFADFVTLQRGFDLPKSEMQEGPYPVVGSTSIIGFHNVYKVEPPGVIMGRSGSLGTIQFVDQPYWPHNTSLWVKDFKGNDPRFVYYSLQCIDFARFNAGAGVPTLNRNHLDNLEVDVPILPIQRKIASILSAYDDLIENNTRRIAILEELARRIYEEWFVHFRFPGHEKVKMAESEFGPRPEGWEVGRLDDAIILQRGFDLPKGNRKEGSVPVYAATGINGSHNEAKVKGPGVVTGRSGSLGTVLYIDEDFWPLNTTLWVKEFKRSTPLHAYYLLSDLDFNKFNSGAAVPTLNRNDIHSLPVILPTQRILTLFDFQVAPVFSYINLLRRKNDNLRITRDFLLPKLISGEIDVSHFPVPEPASI